MAEEDRPSLTALPEIKLARALVAREGLVPPVPVEDLVSARADVRDADFPGSWDAILIEKPGIRPEVILSRAAPRTRRRFTLAHELGHLVIPWSVGMLFCQSRPVHPSGASGADDLEYEANRFASELLVPRGWLRARIEADLDRKLADAIVVAAQVAQVSPVVVALAVPPLCEPGALVFFVNEAGETRYAGSSPGSAVRIPKRWDAAVLAEMQQAGGQLSVVEVGRDTLVAITFQRDDILGDTPVVEDAEQTPLLRGVLAARFDDAESREQARMSVMGIVGSVNSRASSSADESAIYSLLLQSFVSREELRGVLADPDFRRFLRSKARSLYARRRADL